MTQVFLSARHQQQLAATKALWRENAQQHKHRLWTRKRKTIKDMESYEKEVMRRTGGVHPETISKMRQAGAHRKKKVTLPTVNLPD